MTIGNAVTPIQDVPGLSALEIDPEQAAEAYRERIIAPVRGLLPETELAGIAESLSGSCTTEIASFDEFTHLLADDSSYGEYDHIVFDTAPTGHTIRLLQLPGVASADVVFIAVGHAAGRGRLGRPAPRARRRRADRPAHDARARHRHQVDRAGGHGGEGRGGGRASTRSIPFHMCSNPEFLKEGAAIDDFMKPDRVVIGVDSDHARSVMAELYAPFVRTGKPIIFMDIPSAEMTKYAANAMLATRISFMNEIANLCERVGADVDHVRKGIGSDARIGPAFLFPGPGLRRLVLPEGREGARPHGAASAACRCACSRRSRR